MTRSVNEIAHAILTEWHSPDELAHVAYRLMDAARRDAHQTVEHTARTTTDPAANAAAASAAAKYSVAFHAIHAAALPMPLPPMPCQPEERGVLQGVRAAQRAGEALQGVRAAQKARREGKA